MVKHWHTIRLGDACVTNASSYSPKEAWTFVNYLDTGNITENRIDAIQHIDLAKEELPSRAKRKVKKNSIIYSTVRPNQRHYGIIKTIPQNFLVSTGFAVIDADSQLLDADFLYYVLTQATVVDKLHAIAAQSTSAYPSLRPSDIENLEIDIPTLDEQRAIASILRCIDEKIQLNTQINRNLEQQAQAVFRSWFVETANPQWHVGTIADLGEVVGGSTPSKAHSEYYTQHGVAWITPKDLSLDKSKFISHGEIDITHAGLKNSSAKVMPKGTVLFSSRAPIGYIAIAAGEVCTNQGFKSVVPHIHIATPYVYFFLKENLPSIEGVATGSTFKEVSGAAMKSVPAIIPDSDTLNRFTELCVPLFEAQEKLEAESHRLATLRDTLLPKLMSGEIDVSEVAV